MLGDDMDTEEAVTEFVNMLRLGTAALREVVSRDTSFDVELENELNQLLYLMDSLEEVGDSIRSKTRSARRGAS